MCGIAGFWEFGDGAGGAESSAMAARMCERLRHRGPDGSGTWTDDDAGLTLAHTRLAIIDLSEGGAQPMLSSTGRYVISYNGEIYNFPQLKADLSRSGTVFRGGSDTEVILEAVEAWGIEKALRSFVGMFAFALWDREDRRLVLARDRIGEKPLYYGISGSTLLFGSELKALQVHRNWTGEVDRDALSLYFRHNYIPEPYSIYTGIGKLEPGHYVTVSAHTGPDAKKIYDRGSRKIFSENVCYWSLGESYLGDVDPVSDETELVDRFNGLLHQSIAGQMISDVPLGALLSGGIDSSTVAAVMQAQSSVPVKTFSIGFDESEFNEAKYAAAVAKHLGTEHTELYVTPEETRDAIPNLPDLYDEPFSDSSQIPTWLVSRLVRRQVTVCLSGDGGDELFAGYDRYVWAGKIWKFIGWMPKTSRLMAARCLASIPRSAWDKMLLPVKPVFDRIGPVSNLGQKVHRLADTLSTEQRMGLYKNLVSHWHQPDQIVLNASEPITMFDRCPENDRRGFIEQMMYVDTLSYLPGDILTKVDRASMGASLEVRVPFLDHRIIEFAWSVPISFKIRDAKTKWLLRQILRRYVPNALVDRPKMGFAIPVGQWLRGPLREWAEDLLSENEINKHDYLRVEPIRQKWREHVLGQHDWQYHLWDVLMFQSWLRCAT